MMMMILCYMGIAWAEGVPLFLFCPLSTTFSGFKKHLCSLTTTGYSRHPLSQDLKSIPLQRVLVPFCRKYRAESGLHGFKWVVMLAKGTASISVPGTFLREDWKRNFFLTCQVYVDFSCLMQFYTIVSFFSLAWISKTFTIFSYVEIANIWTLIVW